MNKGMMIAAFSFVAVAIIASVVFLFLLGPNGSNTENSLALPSDSTTPQKENPEIAISYSKGARCPAGELIVDLAIKNSGYSDFRISGSSFVATANNVAYHYDFSGSKLLGWQNVNIPNGESYTASIVFKVPEEYNTFVLSYESSSTDYKIVCQPK